MDIFALHITLHFIPRPLISGLVILCLTLLAYVLVDAGPRRHAAAALLAATVMMIGLVLARAPIPQTLQDVRAAPGIALICPLAPPDSTNTATG